MFKKFNEGYTNRTWAHLLLHYLKDAGTKGMTKDEIKALFPSKSDNAIGAVLYRYGITRKAFKDKITGKCKKRYFFLEYRNWKKQIKSLLRSTEYGLSLTDLLLETGVPKKQIEDYLKKLKPLINKIETSKINGHYPIIRYYIGERNIFLKKDEVLYSNLLLNRKNKKILRKKQILTIVQIMNNFIKNQGRFTIKEIQDNLNRNKENISEFHIRNQARKEGFKECKVYQFKDINCRHVPYIVFYLSKKVPLKQGEIEHSIFDLFLEKQITKAIQTIKNPSKLEIRDYVGKVLGQITSGSSCEWSFQNLPESLFQKKISELRKNKKIQMHRKALNGKAIYTCLK